MKLAHAIEGGLAGVTTISLLGETLRKIDGQRSAAGFLDGRRMKKRFKKANSKKRSEATKQYIQLAGEVLGGTAFLGLTSLGKKKNAMLRGALLGTAAGLGVVLLQNHEEENNKTNGHDGFPTTMLAKNTLLHKAAQVGLFALGGLVAGKVLQEAGKGKKRRKKK